jgi:hypothetical protein|nr:MAG TPA: hypothetical protein [Crassvirales sp.]
MYTAIQSLIATNSVSCTSLKQKKVDLIDQPLSLHSTYSVVTSIS